MVARKTTSKKSSGASSHSPPDGRGKSPTFFVDRSLGKLVVAQALREAGANVEVHDDHFSQDATDIEWLTVAGKNNWLVLSKDKQIRRNPLEREALASAGVKAFFLTQQGISGPEMAALFVKVLPGMISRASTQTGPFVYTISRAGEFVRIKK